MKGDMQKCVSDIKANNCSGLKVWEHQRKKHSQNITLLQDKIKSHDNTVAAIVKLNKEETTKKNLTMMRLFPQIRKIKDDIELIESMMWIIEDTYLNLDDPNGASLLMMFDPKVTSSIAQSMIEIKRRHKARRIDHDPGAKPGQLDEIPVQPKPEPKGKPEPKVDPPQGPPLIDENIFDGDASGPEVKARNLFGPMDPEAEAIADPQPDDIPTGVHVKEHDADAVHHESIIKQLKKESSENLQIVELKEAFKFKIKALGKEVYMQLQQLRHELMKEHDQKA